MLDDKRVERRCGAGRQAREVYASGTDRQIAMCLGNLRDTGRFKRSGCTRRICARHQVNAHRKTNIVPAAVVGNGRQQAMFGTAGSTRLDQDSRDIRIGLNAAVRQGTNMSAKCLEASEAEAADGRTKRGIGIDREMEGCVMG